MITDGRIWVWLGGGVYGRNMGKGEERRNYAKELDNKKSMKNKNIT